MRKSKKTWNNSAMNTGKVSQKKRFVALARVSSREQKEQGFSLDVQEEALQKYAERNGGEIVRFEKVAESASKQEARTVFTSLIDETMKNAATIDGILFYKVDRAIRNTADLARLEELENEYGVWVEFIQHSFPHTPAGWMQIRNLANMATYQTQQQSIDVKEGLERRVREGLFSQVVPYGYQNYRENNRGLVRVHPENGSKIKRIFELYAYYGERIDSLVQRLYQEGVYFSPKKPKFSRSKIATILSDQSYIGKIWFREQWREGLQEHLVDYATWQRVQELLHRGHYQSHDLLYAGELIKCGHCGLVLTGENIKKKQKSEDVRVHTYYRCTRYTAPDHPRTRLSEKIIDEQILSYFRQMRIDDESIKNWFVTVIKAKTQLEQKLAMEEITKLQRLQTEIQGKQDRLLNLRMDDEIGKEDFERKKFELREQEANISIRLTGVQQDRHENADLAVKSFELSQNLIQRWDTADFSAKRRILEILCLNLTLNGASLCIEWRKPFDIIAKGLNFSASGEDRI